MTDPTPAEALKVEARPYPDLLSDEEQKALLTRAEELWADLQADNLGGFSGINRPFWILYKFKSVIEAFGRRDVGLSWSKDELEAVTPQAPDAGEVRTYREGVEDSARLARSYSDGLGAPGVVLTERPQEAYLIGVADACAAVEDAIRKLP